jgi:hypothetical protein
MALLATQGITNSCCNITLKDETMVGIKTNPLIYTDTKAYSLECYKAYKSKGGTKPIY